MGATMTTITRRRLLLGLASTALLALAGCTPPALPSLRMGCGESGGSYLQFGRLLQRSLRRHDIDLQPLVTEGSVENLDRLADRTADVAIVLADSAAEAPAGLVALGRVYQNYLQCVVRRDGDVRTLADLSGRKVSIGAPRSGTAVTARRVLAAVRALADTEPAEIVELTLSEAVAALENREVDAFFWSGGIPTPQIEQVSATTAVRLLDPTPVLPSLDADFPNLYVSTSVPAGVYGAPDRSPTVGISNLLLARADLPDHLAETIVDALIDDARRLVPPDSVGVQYLTLSNLIDTATLPLHPAAERRYRQRYG